MSCPEVVYQAYYPYLYQRPGSSTASNSGVHRTSFSAFAHQYDRFNVQRCFDQASPTVVNEPYQLSTPAHVHSHSSQHSSAGSVSSGGGVGSPGSPTVPNTIRYKEEPPDIASKEEKREPAEEEDDDNGSTTSNGRVHYLSANCVIFTNYTGDVSAVVDEHFSKALSFVVNKGAVSKDYSPMITRNFPPSFWNSNYQPSPCSASATHHSSTNAGASVTDFYSGESAYHAAVAAAASTPSSVDPWHSHYQQYAAHHHHHRAVHDYHHHHHNMAAQYSSLLLPTTTRLPAHMASHQYHHHHSKSGMGVEHWSSTHTAAAAAAAAAAARLHHDQSSSAHHGLDTSPSNYASYPSVPGLETQVQETSKDLYWF